jgi:hypothetical protein
MRVHEFLNLVNEQTRSQLPLKLRFCRTWKRYTLIQLYYGKRGVHYEVWVRGKERVLEIGLHCEADRETNAALLEHLAGRVFEIKDALGDQVEAEQWTSSWTRVHQLMPYEKLDEMTGRAAATRLAQMIAVLQPMVDAARRDLPKASARRASRATPRAARTTTSPTANNGRKAARSRTSGRELATPE